MSVLVSEDSLHTKLAPSAQSSCVLARLSAGLPRVSRGFLQSLLLATVGLHGNRHQNREQEILFCALGLLTRAQAMWRRRRKLPDWNVGVKEVERGKTCRTGVRRQEYEGWGYRSRGQDGVKA